MFVDYKYLYVEYYTWYIDTYYAAYLRMITTSCTSDLGSSILKPGIINQLS